MENDTEALRREILAEACAGAASGLEATPPPPGAPQPIFHQNVLVYPQAVPKAAPHSINRNKFSAATSTSFADDWNVAKWAKAEVAFMSSKGIVEGKGNNLASPPPAPG